jgi:hypothetical protein
MRYIEAGMLCFLRGNLYEDPGLDWIFDSTTRRVHVLEKDEYDETWGQKWKIETDRGPFVVSEQDLSPVPDLKPEKTQRGWNIRGFQDMYGSDCSIQDSSLATDDAIWFGVDDGGHFNMKTPAEQWNPEVHGRRATGGRMHLSRGQVSALLPLLEHFVKYGMLPED